MPGEEQSALMELFYENNESMSGYFYAWVASKDYSWMFHYRNFGSFFLISIRFLLLGFGKNLLEKQYIVCFLIEITLYVVFSVDMGTFSGNATEGKNS